MRWCGCRCPCWHGCGWLRRRTKGSSAAAHTHVVVVSRSRARLCLAPSVVPLARAVVRATSVAVAAHAVHVRRGANVIAAQRANETVKHDSARASITTTLATADNIIGVPCECRTRGLGAGAGATTHAHVIVVARCTARLWSTWASEGRRVSDWLDERVSEWTSA